MDDLISRQAAIDALDKRFDDVPMELTTEILQLRRDLRERIPSAQPATSCSEIPNSSDSISRRAAIDAVEKAKMAQTPDGEIFVAKYNAEMNIQLLPPVQPVLTCKGCSNDCISRKAAMLALDTVRIQGNDSWYTYYQKALNAMIKLPAIQPEIIRCKDCKYWRDDHTCHEHSLVSPMCANEYCSRAERRAERENDGHID